MTYSSEVIGKHYSTPSSPLEKIARQEFNFRTFFGILRGIHVYKYFGSCMVYTKTIIHPSVVERGGHLLYLNKLVLALTVNPS